MKRNLDSFKVGVLFIFWLCRLERLLNFKTPSLEEEDQSVFKGTSDSDNGLAINPFPNHLGGIWIPTVLVMSLNYPQKCFPVIIPGFCFGYD